MAYQRERAQDSNEFTRAYFDQLLIEMRHMDGVKPNTTLQLFGKTFSTPVMTAALSHLKGKNHTDGLVDQANAARMAGAVNWMGMSTPAQLPAIAQANQNTIRIIKPYADESLVLERLEQAEEAGLLAVGMDLDHSFNGRGECDCVVGNLMRPRTMTEIASYCKRTRLPFIIKGVLSTIDAQKCLDAGVQGIVVSHHHGIMPSAVPPLMVLPHITEKIGGRIPIFVDCGIMNGVDVFKALALGATAVSVGRAMIPAMQENGAQGGADALNDITAELKGIMARTCAGTLKEIDKSMLWFADGRRV